MSPQVDPSIKERIENQNGKIDQIRNNQNGLMSELGTLKNQSDIQNSRLEKIQQGMVNLQSNNENHGVQILSGSAGTMIAIIGIVAIAVIITHLHGRAVIQEKTAKILAQNLVNLNDPAVEEAVFQAAMHTNAEANMLHLIKKMKKDSI